MTHQKHKLIAFQDKVIVKFIFKNPSPILPESDGTMITPGDERIHILMAKLPRLSAFHMLNRNCLICTENVSRVHALMLWVIFYIQWCYIPRVTPIPKTPYYYFTYDKKLAMKNKLPCIMSHSLVAQDINSWAAGKYIDLSSHPE